MTTITGKCHCGAVRFTHPGPPDHATSCNCSICRRLGALWIRGTADQVKLEGEDATLVYNWGDREIDFHTCRTCGVTTHFRGRNDPYRDQLSLNLNLAELDVIRTVPVRHFDGADTWEFLD